MYVFGPPPCAQSPDHVGCLFELGPPNDWLHAHTRSPSPSDPTPPPSACAGVKPGPHPGEGEEGLVTMEKGGRGREGLDLCFVSCSPHKHSIRDGVQSGTDRILCFSLLFFSLSLKMVSPKYHWRGGRKPPVDKRS